jgi:hypothetical protein
MSTHGLLLPLYRGSVAEARRRAGSPALVAMALVRNEGDIVAAWLAHAAALFDFVYLVDHRSTDGTREFLLEQAGLRDNLALFSFDGLGYLQAELTDELARTAAAEWPDAWLFALDADEFVGMPSKAALVDKVSGIADDRALRLHWRNCVPLSVSEDTLFRPRAGCMIPPYRSVYSKLAMHAAAYRDRGYRYDQGNHEIRRADGELVPETLRVEIGDLFHVPLRSLDHLALKCVQGCLAYHALPVERRDLSQGIHWRQMVEDVTRAGSLSADRLREFAASYGGFGDPNFRKGRGVYDLIRSGWTCEPLPVALDPRIPAMDRKQSFAGLIAATLHEAPRYLQAFLTAVRRGTSPEVELVSRVLACSASNRRFEALGPGDDEPVAETELLSRVLHGSSVTQESPTPSAWAEHVPFLFFAIDLLQPRRFVELGSHQGNSFFAACQAGKALPQPMECVAIDTWEGDEHAGAYEEHIFRDFSFILQREYGSVGRYIRKTFNAASGQFAPGSIDLLHIDGLHTYEAVAEDYRTWLPKMSERGLILFHDTRVFERGFGVWRLWDEIKDQFPSFELTHGYGLGVLAVGCQPSARVTQLMKLMASPELGGGLRDFFASAGRFATSRVAVEMGSALAA